MIRERISHVNRIKGLLYSRGIKGYEPLRRNRRDKLEMLTTGDGRDLPPYLKTQIGRELDRIELLLRQIAAMPYEVVSRLGFKRPPQARFGRPSS